MKRPDTSAATSMPWTSTGAPTTSDTIAYSHGSSPSGSIDSNRRLSSTHTIAVPRTNGPAVILPGNGQRRSTCNRSPSRSVSASDASPTQTRGGAAPRAGSTAGAATMRWLSPSATARS